MGTLCVIVKPPASCSTRTGAADVANNGLIIVDVLPPRRAAGVQPRVRNRASHGTPRQTAFMRRDLLQTRMYHLPPSFIAIGTGCCVVWSGFLSSFGRPPTPARRPATPAHGTHNCRYRRGSRYSLRF